MTALELRQDGQVLHATMTGSTVNAVDTVLLHDLQALADRIETDESVRAVVITGAGKTFCVGLDLAVLARGFAEHPYLMQFLSDYHQVLRRLETAPATVIAAINGLARAGGLELLLACDLVLVADSARIADHHLHSGILPGGGASARLPRRIGAVRARELLLTARWLTGPQAVEYGLAIESVPLADLAATCDRVAALAADKPRAVIAATKALLDEADGMSVARACELELIHFARYLAEEPLASEGYQAFVDGREPSWRTQ